MQIHEQQAEKQKKNPLQKTLLFSRRATSIMLLDSLLHCADQVWSLWGHLHLPSVIC